MSPYILGVTGLIGSGKSTVSAKIVQLLNDKCVPAEHINTDMLFKKALSNGIFADTLNSFMGRKIYGNFPIDIDYVISVLSRMNEDTYSELCRLIGQFMHRHIMDIIEECDSRVYVIESATLLQSPTVHMCQHIVRLSVPEHIRLERVSKRDEGKRSFESTKTLMAIQSKMRNESYQYYMGYEDTIDAYDDVDTEVASIVNKINDRIVY